MSERTDHLTDDGITQFLRTRSADPDLGLLDDIMRTVGAAPQDRPWLGLRPIALPRRTLLIVAVALLVAAMGAVAVGSGFLLPVMPEGPFEGTWVSSSDADGGTQTMTVQVSADGAVEIVVRDDVATVCSFTPSTMTGTGRIEGGTQLVIPSPVYTCDDGSVAQALSGPPLQEQLRDWTLVLDPQTDTLSDGFGGLWLRKGAEDPNPEPAISGVMWPQSSLEEAREAQRLADAGDPAYAWQAFPAQRLATNPGGAEFFTRFLQDELGWEEFRWGVGGELYPDDSVWVVMVVRCAPGRTNPLYPNDPRGGGCAPTIDENRYETVKIGADQPVRIDDPSGIWVVTGWEMLPQSDEPITGWADFFGQQVEQVAPPSDAEATEFLRAFLQARVTGEDADLYLHSHAEQAVAQQACSVNTSASCAEIPLLYATTSDAPYERFEFELVEGPVWPGGWTEFNVRLFAEGGNTVVEQRFLLHRGKDGRLGLVYETLGDEDVPTTENGKDVGLPWELLDGEVTFLAPTPWYEFYGFGPGTIALVQPGLSGDVAVLADPLPVETGCQQGPAPADAAALARSIRSDPDLDTTEPVAVSVGGIEALRMDVVAATGASVCDYHGTPLVIRGPSEEARPMGPSLDRGDRMRLYLLDVPEGSSIRILAIAVVAPEARFERVMEAATPIIDSIEFHPG